MLLPPILLVGLDDAAATSLIALLRRIGLANPTLVCGQADAAPALLEGTASSRLPVVVLASRAASGGDGLYEAVAAASATVAAHFRYLETVAAWLSRRGLPSAAARRYVADVFAALAGELATPDADFSALAHAHATPGGLNEQFARDLAAAGTYDAVEAGLDAVLDRIAWR